MNEYDGYKKIYGRPYQIEMTDELAVETLQRIMRDAVWNAEHDDAGNWLTRDPVVAEMVAYLEDKLNG